MGVSAALLVVGSLAGAAATGAFSSTKAPPPTAAQKPTPMPTADGASIEAARRRSVATQMGRRGRQSTILTGDDDKLGG